MHFSVEGPFELKRQGNKKIITKESAEELRAHLQSTHSGLEDACGCYVFAIRAGKGFTPFYVGQSRKRALWVEALNDSNKEKYNKALDKRKGTPVLFLLPLLTPTGKFKKQGTGERKNKSLDFLERWLITNAINKNPELTNNKETRHLRNLHVKGVFNAKKGEATRASSALKKTLF